MDTWVIIIQGALLIFIHSSNAFEVFNKHACLERNYKTEIFSFCPRYDIPFDVLELQLIFVWGIPIAIMQNIRTILVCCKL